ncbi:MAG: hypothetical protein M9894_05255 [Planctomycetes bacterium]|nr:hypothetical protein [Planctomycetota bacterium]
MSLSAFLVALEESGRVLVPAAPRLAPGDGDDADARLAALHARAAADLAGAAPALDLPAARWAAWLVFDACQALAHRSLAAAEVQGALARPCPSAPGPRAVFSADLVLQVLPDLLRLARGLGDDDALTVGLRAVGRAWPLSSVGAPLGPGPWPVDAFARDPGLLALYADRVLLRGDRSRVGDPRVDDALREALGACPELSPEVARALGLLEAAA